MDVMQKRGQLYRPQTGEAWQLLCDEGSGLGGTDWAPPPLAYFAAGLASSLTGTIADLLRERDIHHAQIQLVLDNQYSLKGSILRGTMEGKGLDPDLAVSIDNADLTPADKSSLVMEAVASGLAGYMMKQTFVSEFSLVANDERVDLDLPLWDQSIDAAALPTLPVAAEKTDRTHVTKAFVRPENPQFNPGTGAGHDAVQNRNLTVSSVTKGTVGSALTFEAGIARPKASVYEISGAPDAGGQNTPSSAILLAAGIGFCYMTQLGRYAEAKKRPVKDYRMIQAIDVPLPGSDGSQTPVIGTKLFLDQTEPDRAFARDLAHSAKRTCFLHSTLQSRLRYRVTVT